MEHDGVSDKRKSVTMLVTAAVAVLAVGVLVTGCLVAAFVLWIMMGGPVDLSALAE
jgi:hypothetical protein